MGSSARYKGVIFDWDGTLANTVELNCQVWRKVMLNHGADIPSERFKPDITLDVVQKIPSHFRAKYLAPDMPGDR